MKICKDYINFNYQGPRGPVCLDGGNFDYESNTYQDIAYKCRKFFRVIFKGFEKPPPMAQGRLL